MATLKTHGHLFANPDAKAAEIMEGTFAKVRQPPVETVENRTKIKQYIGRGLAGGNPVAISPGTL